MDIDVEKLEKETLLWNYRKDLWEQLFSTLEKLSTVYNRGDFVDHKWVKNENFIPYLGEFDLSEEESFSLKSFDGNKLNRIAMTTAYFTDAKKTLGEVLRMEYDYLHEEHDRAKIIKELEEKMKNLKKGKKGS